MTKLQWVVLGSAIALALLIYIGCDTKAPQQQRAEQSRLLEAEATDVTVLIRQAHEQLEPAQIATIGTLEERLELVTDDSTRADALRQLSGRWYEYGHPAIAGHYAGEIAQLTNTGEAWSIAGTTYAICVQRSPEERIREFCSKRSVEAFENAISLDPDNVANRLNLALVYTDAPPADNPMKGVLMLRELQEQYPRNVQVLVSLGRLSIRTGQYQRAVQRLQQALAIDDSNRDAICLLQQAYEGLGDRDLAQAFAERCQR